MYVLHNVFFVLIFFSVFFFLFCGGQEFAPSDEELEAYRKGMEWDPLKAEEKRRLKVSSVCTMKKNTFKRCQCFHTSYAQYG